MIRPGEAVAAVAAVALLAIMGLAEWYAPPASEPTEGWTGYAPLEGSANAWQALGLLDVALLVPVALALALALLSATRRSPAIPVALALLLVPAALLACLGLLYRLLDPPGGLLVDTGAWLGLACALGLLAGAWLALRDERPSRRAPTPVDVVPRPAPPA